MPLTTLWVSQGIYHPILADKLLECLLKGVGSRQGTLNDWSSLSITRASLMFPKEKFFAWAKTSLWERTNSWHYFELFFGRTDRKTFFRKRKWLFSTCFFARCWSWGKSWNRSRGASVFCSWKMRSGVETGKSFLLKTTSPILLLINSL